MIKNRKIENRKIGNRKIENRKKSENWKKSENRKISKSGPNHGANERPKGEPVAVGDLKASCKNVCPQHYSKIVWIFPDFLRSF